MKPESIEWFIDTIRALPSDEPAPTRQAGYNNYRTQKEHWLGWLDPNSGTGTYPRKTGPERNAKLVYNHIMEPKMLLWLTAAAGVRRDMLHAAQQAAESATTLAGKSAAIRRNVPWSEVLAALSTK